MWGTPLARSDRRYPRWGNPLARSDIGVPEVGYPPPGPGWATLPPPPPHLDLAGVAP